MMIEIYLFDLKITEGTDEQHHKRIRPSAELYVFL